jgi:TPR repeat protein
MSVLITACATQESSLRARAEAGDAEAQYQLASMYWQGKEIDQNRNEALKWY